MLFLQPSEDVADKLQSDEISPETQNLVSTVQLEDILQDEIGYIFGRC